MDSRENQTYIRSYLGQHQVDAPADDVVAPCSVVISIRLLRQGAYAFADARPLRVCSRASHLCEGTDDLDALGLELRVGDRGSFGGLDPVVEVRDPCVVFQNSPLVIKLPERHLDGHGQNGAHTKRYSRGKSH